MREIDVPVRLAAFLPGKAREREETDLLSWCRTEVLKLTPFFATLYSACELHLSIDTDFPIVVHLAPTCRGLLTSLGPGISKTCCWRFRC